MRRLVAELEPNDYVFGARTRKTTRNLLSGFVENSAGNFRPRSDRMRATWLVTHLTAGTNMAALMRAAGVEKFENLARYLAYVPELGLSVPLCAGASA